MKKTILILMAAMLVFTSIAFACDSNMEGMDDHSHESEVTGAATGFFGMTMSGFGYLWLIVFLYFAIGLGYVIYKLNKIEEKIRIRKK